MLVLLSLLIFTIANGRRLPDSMRLRPGLKIDCPCANTQECKPVQITHSKEIFGFSADPGVWEYFPFDLITTIAWAPNDPQLMCTAHRHNTRLIAGAPDKMPLTANRTERELWINSAVQMAKDNFLDGITFDYESPMTWNSPDRNYYTQIVTETTAAFHKEIPGSQVSVCVAWSPDDIDGRAYDYHGLVQGSDLFYVMAYDTRSQIFDRCIASANTPIGIAKRGLQRYIDIGMPKEKLILGLPWYGYTYPCQQQMKPDDVFCPIKMVPFRDVNCSDAAGSEISYDRIMALVDSKVPLQGVLWDDSTQCPYFNYLVDGVVHQMWFDNPKSLQLKYDIAKEMGVRGVGPFTFTYLDPTGKKTNNPLAPAEAAAMWAALRTFVQGK